MKKKESKIDFFIEQQKNNNPKWFKTGKELIHGSIFMMKQL